MIVVMMTIYKDQQQDKKEGEAEEEEEEEEVADKEEAEAEARAPHGIADVGTLQLLPLRRPARSQKEGQKLRIRWCLLLSVERALIYQATNVETLVPSGLWALGSGRCVCLHVRRMTAADRRRDEIQMCRSPLPATAVNITESLQSTSLEPQIDFAQSYHH